MKHLIDTDYDVIIKTDFTVKCDEKGKALITENSEYPHREIVKNIYFIIPVYSENGVIVSYSRVELTKRMVFDIYTKINVIEEKEHLLTSVNNDLPF